MRGSPAPARGVIGSWAFVVSACLFLLLLTAGVAVAVAQDDRRHAEERQERQLLQAEAALVARLQTTMDRLQDAGRLLTAFGSDSEATRTRWYEVLRERVEREPALFGSGYAVVVPDEERAAFERAQGAPIKAPDATGQLRVAPRRTQYVVPVAVTYRDGGRAGLGVDLAAEPRRGAAFAAAARLGEPQIAGPVPIVGGRDQLLLVYVPVLHSDRRSVGGFAIASFQAREFLRRMREVVYSGTAFSVSVGGTVLGDPIEDDAGARSEAVEVGGTEFLLTVGRVAPFYDDVWVTIVGGVLLTFLVGGLLARAVVGERRASVARVVAERQFVTVFEQAPIGMAVINREGRFERVNAAFCALLRRPQEELVGHETLEFVHEDDREAATAVPRALAAGAPRAEADQRVLLPDGSVAVMSCTGSALRTGGRATGWLLQVQDVTDRRAYEARLQHLADHDPLTGLLNRRSFLELLERHVALARRYGDRGAVLLLDLDHFKAVNDLLGHGAGDRLIVDIARALEARLRDSDVLARLGGDEFAVLLPEATLDEARLLSQDLLAVVGDVAVSGVPVHRGVSASIGLTAVRQDAADAEAVLVEADLALYDAKDDGRNRVVGVGEPGRRPTTETRLAWATRVGDALQTGAFALVHQPIVDLRTREVSGLEALVRMRMEDGRLATPGEFLAVAERHGLAPKVDLWVLGAVVEELDELARRGVRPTVSVNVSAHSFADPGYALRLEGHLRDTDVDPSQLMFELTETVAVADLDQARAFGASLRRLGCRLALDDFGAGFASFAFLRALHFDVLKIDGAFVRGCATDGLDRQIVASVVAIAEERGSQTVAEHVVSAEVAEALVELGVDYGQGYHFGRPGPMPPAAVLQAGSRLGIPT